LAYAKIGHKIGDPEPSLYVRLKKVRELTERNAQEAQAQIYKEAQERKKKEASEALAAPMVTAKLKLRKQMYEELHRKSGNTETQFEWTGPQELKMR
jgi:hypothetical protein